MTDWLNHAAVAAPRNGTNSHTVGPNGTGGTVVAGSAFTPTAGNFLLVVVDGAVTSTTPAGWTLPTNGSAINNTGLYVWYRASAAGSDTIATTHNGVDYPAVFDFYEFPAGSTFKSSAAATAVSASGGAGPTLSGLTGTNWTAGAAGQNRGPADPATTITWNAGTEATDTSAAASGTDGYTYGLTYTDDDVATSKSYAATFSSTSFTVERLVFAVVAADPPPPAAVGILLQENGHPLLQETNNMILI